METRTITICDKNETTMIGNEITKIETRWNQDQKTTKAMTKAGILRRIHENWDEIEKIEKIENFENFEEI
jgi:hypothetical protein